MKPHSIPACHTPADPDAPEVELLVYYTFTKGDPGRYFGRPEDCYPAEPAEVEFDSVTHLDGTPAPEFADWAREWLAGEGFDAAVEEASDDGPDPDDARDRDIDDKLMGVGRYAPMEGGEC